ncbi:MAG: D-alanyl-D-alanine carboxypeptidase family protein [Lachnospiraceae bacterium]|nr:D-alanyl-D-alanine carboxypeptidase family protein [Lachnospiraceae bacterium]
MDKHRDKKFNNDKWSYQSANNAKVAYQSINNAKLVYQSANSAKLTLQNANNNRIDFKSINKRMKNNQLLIVNKKNILPQTYIPKDLEYVNVTVDVPDEKKFMRKEAAKYLRRMFKSAADVGVELVAISGFRSYERQKEIYEKSLIEQGKEHTEKYIAYPGTSEHQTGLAMDISCREIDYKLVTYFERTKEGIWLKNNVQNYGFIIRYPRGYSQVTGYAYEPWHVRYIGVRHAKAMRRARLNTLEGYVLEYDI